MNKEKFGEGTLLGYLVFAQFKAYSALFGRGGRGGVEEKMWFHSSFSLPLPSMPSQKKTFDL